MQGCTIGNYPSNFSMPQFRVPSAIMMHTAARSLVGLLKPMRFGVW